MPNEVWYDRTIDTLLAFSNSKATQNKHKLLLSKTQKHIRFTVGLQVLHILQLISVNVALIENFSIQLQRCMI